MTEQRDMIPTARATRLYGVTYRKLRRWADEGRICEPERDGREVRWNAVEIEELLNLIADEGRQRLPRRRARPALSLPNR